MVSTTAGAGAATPAVAPADLAGTDVPAVVGMNFSAVAEVYSRPLVICPLIIQTGGTAVCCCWTGSRVGR